MNTSNADVSPAVTNDAAAPTETDLPVPERLWEWVRARPAIGHAVLIREQGAVVDRERLFRDDLTAELNRAARSGYRVSVVVPSRARLADVTFRVVGVREPATVIWDATVESLELDAALKALGMTLTFHASRPYRGTGERSTMKGHIVMPYTVTSPPWMRPCGGGSVTAPNEEEGRRTILRAVRGYITTMLSERERSCEDLAKRIETVRSEALALVDALSLIDRAPERT